MNSLGRVARHLGRSGHAPRLQRFRAVSSEAKPEPPATAHPVHPDTHHPSADSPLASEPLTYPDAPSSRHHSLASFLQYARDSGLNPESTVYVGTRYEYTVSESLARYGFSLRRIGGASDYGIDLLGTWAVPSALGSPLKVLLQCKASTGKIYPSFVRELEGAFVGAPPGWRGAGVIGMLVCRKDATKGILDSLGRSRWPMGFVKCSDDGHVLQMLWNRRAIDQGLDGMGVTLQYGSGEGRDIALTFKGSPLPFAPWTPTTDENFVS